MVHLDHLELLCRCKFLLNQRVPLSSMCLLNLSYLTHKSFFILGNLLRTDLFNLVREFNHRLCMIRLQLLFIVSEIFDLLFILLDLKLKLSLFRFLLQRSDLFLRQAFLLTHLSVK